MADCLGCGFCCRQGPCGIAARTGTWRKPEKGGCRSLKWDGEKWRCVALKVNPQYYRELAVGAGCSSSLFNTDREKIPTPEVIAERYKTVKVEVDWKKAFRALSRAMGRQMTSSDRIILTAHAMKKDLPEEEFPVVAEEFTHNAFQNRNKFTEEMMG